MMVDDGRTCAGGARPGTSNCGAPREGRAAGASAPWFVRGGSRMRQLSTRWWFWLTGVIIAGCLTVLALCWSYRVWSFDGWRVYRAMATECPPAWRDYH